MMLFYTFIHDGVATEVVVCYAFEDFDSQVSHQLRLWHPRKYDDASFYGKINIELQYT